MYHLDYLQPEIWTRLVKIASSSRVGSAYLFSGPEGAGKEVYALEFAAMLNCADVNKPCGTCASCLKFSSLQHEYLYIVPPLPRANDKDKDSDILSVIGEKNEKLLIELIQKKSADPFVKINLPLANRILINSIRDLRKKLYLKSFVQGYKIVVILDAHLLSAGAGESAGALLKILEEPPDKTVFILVTDYKTLILPTIQSRCQHIDFPPLKTAAIQTYLENRSIDAKASELFSNLTAGNMHRAMALAERNYNSTLKMIREQFAVITHENAGVWKNYINKMSLMVRDDMQEFRFNLFLLMIWFQQSYRIRAGLVSFLAQNGFADELDSFNQSYPDAKIKEIVDAIESALNAVKSNFYMPLAITNMLINISRNLRGYAVHAP